MQRPWWQEAVFYQIYPRSFADASGDGVGDLRGIVDRLDHVRWLGADAIWCSPFYRSPMRDFGYDISDHTDVDPVFGTLADADALVARAHDLGLRVVLDFVGSHTSDEHPWFVASRSGREHPQRSWYVWADGRDGGPPNNWMAAFPPDTPAWTYGPRTGQWYVHSHLSSQPDLNWDEPAVREAVADVVRFWLERGVDGFRFDAVARTGKDPSLRDNPPEGPPRQQNWPSVHDHLRSLRAVLDEYPDKVAVGEVWLHDQHELIRYVRDGGIDLAHNFVFAHLPWDPESFALTVDAYDDLCEDDVWPAWFLGNHDEPRIASRFGADGLGEQRARLVALLLLTLRGTPFLYQGDELALPDTPVPSTRAVDPGGRDPERTPMPWAPPSVAGPGAGFTSGTPWLPLGPDAETRNVASQRADGRSTLHLHRRLIALRRRLPALLAGSHRTVALSPSVWAYERRLGDQRVVVALNFSTRPAALPDVGTESMRLLVSSDPDRDEGTVVGELRLAPLEGVVVASG